MVSILEQVASGTGIAGRLPLWLGHTLWDSLDNRCEWQAAFRVSVLVLRIAERAGDEEMSACGHLLQARSEATVETYGRARELAERALALVRNKNNPVAAAMILNGLGVIETRRGDAAAALSRYVEALEVAGQDSLTSLRASVLTNMCVSYAEQGMLDRAIEVAEQSASICAATDDSTVHVSTMVNLAAVRCLSGDYANAVRCAETALALGRETGDRLRECEALIARSETHVRRRDLRRAYVDVDVALNLAEDVGHRYALASAQRQRSRILALMGRIEESVLARSLADKSYRELRGFYSDPTIELLLATEAE